MQSADHALIVNAAADPNLRTFLVGFFSECGTLTSLAIVPDRSDSTRSMAVIQFAHSNSVEISLHFTNSSFSGKPVIINKPRPNFICPTKSGEFPVNQRAPNLTLEEVVVALHKAQYEIPESLVQEYCQTSNLSSSNPSESVVPVKTDIAIKKSKNYGSMDDDKPLTGPFSPITLVDSSQTTFDISYRVILVGDSGVGKTNIINRWTQDIYSGGTQSTISIEFKNKLYKIDGLIICVQLWDTAGQERFRSLAAQYYRKANGVVIVYDITRPGSYDSIKVWLDQVEAHSGNPEENLIQYLLIGNKRDLEDERVIRTEDALAFAKSRNMAFMETSAREGTNCMRALQIIMQDIHAIQSANRGNFQKEQKGAISISGGEKIESQIESNSTTSNCC